MFKIINDINVIVKILFNLLSYNPRKMFLNIISLPNYFRKFVEFNLKLKTNNSEFKIKFINPQLLDKFDWSGSYDSHYFKQDLFVAQKIFKANPIRHMDIGSRVDGFCAHVASFRELEVFDIRDSKDIIENIKFIKADIMNFDSNLINSFDSISSLHAIEHFGLGRYGDEIDPNGHLKAFDNIYRYLRTGGTLYLSVPISKNQRVEYNAHRVFSLKYLIKLTKGKYRIKSFSYINDNGELHKHACIDKNNSFNLNFGCGIFELIKI